MAQKNAKHYLGTGPRAACPLCGSWGYGIGAHGYSLPEGLRRHLEGYGRVQECEVMFEGASACP
jgi:hypothetical protein